MEQEDDNKKTCYTNKIKDIVTKELEQFSDTDLDSENLDILYKLVDIDKDLENIDYWKAKKEVMKMRYNYGEYSDGGYSYGRRGVPGTGRRRYRGYGEGLEVLEDIKESYGAYNESMGAYSRGNYAAGQDGMKMLEDTMMLIFEFVQKLEQDAETPEAKQIIKKHLRKLSQMGDM